MPGARSADHPLRTFDAAIWSSGEVIPDLGGVPVMDDLIRNSSWLGGLLLVVAFVTSLIPGTPGSAIQGFALAIMLFAYAGGTVYLTGAGLVRARLLWPAWRQSLLVAFGVPGILAAALLLALPTLALGNQLYIWSLATVGRGWLDRTVAQVQSDRQSFAQERVIYRDSFIPYRTDTGPPVRVAFMTNAGFLGDGAGIVFDPTGKVRLARGWDASGKFYAPPEVTKLFGGDLVDCDHLVAAYYYCSFS